MLNNEQKAIYLRLALAITIISFSGILIKLSTAPPLITAFYRMLFSSLLLTPYFLYRYRDQARHFFDYRPAVVGFLIAMHFILWITAFEYTNVANAVIFVSMQPLFTIILEYIFARQDLRKKVVAGVLLALIGSIIISIGDISTLFNKIWGDLLALLAAFFISSYLFIGRSIRNRLAYFPYIYIIYTYAALTIGIFVLLTDLPLTGYGQTNYLIFLGLAVGPTLVGHSILNHSVRYVPTSIVSLTILGEPVLTTLLAWLILGEKVAFITIFGGAFILGGIYIATVRNKKKKEK